MEGTIGQHASQAFTEVQTHGEAVRPLDFPPPRVRAGVRVNALVVHPESGSRQVCSGVIHREDLTEVANLRVLLECHALRLSVEKGDTDWEGNLVAAHHKLHLMEQKMMAGDESHREDWKRYDWEFHLALIQACGSKNLLSLHSVLYDKYLRYQMLVLTYRGEEAVEEHRRMFEAALDRDIERASEELKVHIEKGLEHTLAAF